MLCHSGQARSECKCRVTNSSCAGIPQLSGAACTLLNTPSHTMETGSHKTALPLTRTHTSSHLSVTWQLRCTALNAESPAIACSASCGRLGGHTANTLACSCGGFTLEDVNSWPPWRLQQQRKSAERQATQPPVPLLTPKNKHNLYAAAPPLLHTLAQHSRSAPTAIHQTNAHPLLPVLPLPT